MEVYPQWFLYCFLSSLSLPLSLSRALSFSLPNLLSVYLFLSSKLTFSLSLSSLQLSFILAWHKLSQSILHEMSWGAHVTNSPYELDTLFTKACMIPFKLLHCSIWPQVLCVCVWERACDCLCVCYCHSPCIELHCLLFQKFPFLCNRIFFIHFAFIVLHSLPLNEKHKLFILRLIFSTIPK